MDFSNLNPKIVTTNTQLKAHMGGNYQLETTPFSSGKKAFVSARTDRMALDAKQYRTQTCAAPEGAPGLRAVKQLMWESLV